MVESVAKRPVRPERVTVYTTKTCHWCKVAKAYLIDNEIEFREVDIIADAKGRKEMALMTGQFGVPVIAIDGRAMVGWDPREFERLRGHGR